MKKLLSLFLALLIQVMPLPGFSKPFVICNLFGPLGHQMFQVATAFTVAKDNNAIALFPDLHRKNRDNLAEHHRMIFAKLNATKPPKQPKKKYIENQFRYTKIPFTPNMRLSGYFQSEKYFSHRKELIQQIFAPSSEIAEDLQKHYGDIIADPKSVAIHVQKNPQSIDPEKNIYTALGRKYIQHAIEMFPDDYHFYIFSDDLNWCMESLSDLTPHMRFISTSSIYHDFYLQSMCQHNIISNTSFAWWAAWLNKNPNKIVIAPKHWFTATYGSDAQDLIPESWYRLD